MYRHLQLPHGKRIRVYSSGDEHFPGVPILVNPRYVKNVGSLLAEATEKISPAYGQVRSLHTPNTGTVITDLSSITRQGNYVAAGPKGFVSVPGGYENIGHPGYRRSRLGIHGRPNQLVPLHKTESYTVTIYPNGEPNRPTPFRIATSDFLQWGQALHRLSMKVKLTGGPVRRLYHLSGELVRRPEEVSNYGSYVAAAAREPFKMLSYGDPLSSSNTARFSKSKPYQPTYTRRISQASQRSKDTESGSGGSLRQEKDEEEDNEKEEGDKAETGVLEREEEEVEEEEEGGAEEGRSEEDDLKEYEAEGREEGLVGEEEVMEEEEGEYSGGVGGGEGDEEVDDAATDARHTHTSRSENSARLNSLRLQSPVITVDPPDDNNNNSDEGEVVEEVEEGEGVYSYGIRGREEPDEGIDEEDPFYSDSTLPQETTQRTPTYIPSVIPEGDGSRVDYYNLGEGDDEGGGGDPTPLSIYSPRESPPSPSSYRSGVGPMFYPYTPIMEEEEDEQEGQQREDKTQPTTDEEELRREDSGVRQKDSVAGDEEREMLQALRTDSRNSNFDSGRASFLSDEERPDSVFRAKTRLSRPVTTEVDYDTDEGGMYRSKERAAYSRGAQEILDSSATHVDLPVDMMEATEVQEEVLVT